ncbi:MAG: flagellar hook-length control protein FliK [Lachnospiraceae bacterium]|nr:flagellar hook-length control protein FliK [Lachnospiraceae bacterium]
MTAVNDMNGAMLLRNYTDNLMGKQGKATGDDQAFQAAFDNAGKNSLNEAPAPVKTESGKRKADDAYTRDASKTEDKPVNKKADTSKAEDKQALKDAKEADNEAEISGEKAGKAKKAVSDILKGTAETLDIDLEELEKIMEQLGLTAADLLQPENINLLAAEVLSDGNTLSLITDAGAYDAAKQIGNLVSDILKEADISPEDIEFFEENLAAFEPVEVWSDADAAKGADDVIKMTRNATDDNIAVTAAGAEVQGQADASLSQKGAGQTDNKNGNSSSHSDNRRDTRFSDRVSEVNIQNVNSGINTADADALVSASDEQNIPRTYLEDYSKTVDQVLNHIKANVTEDFKSLEMSLHPASLGNVAVNLVSRNGVLTAEFTTQTDAARAALESQLAVLKENLEQQGVKIEAVEVTVSSHAFEENLEQGNNGSSDAEADERERLRRATRRIDLGPFGEDGLEDISEADMVTADMMRSDGNRMDYRA